MPAMDYLSDDFSGHRLQRFAGMARSYEGSERGRRDRHACDDLTVERLPCTRAPGWPAT